MEIYDTNRIFYYVLTYLWRVWSFRILPRAQKNTMACETLSSHLFFAGFDGLVFSHVDTSQNMRSGILDHLYYIAICNLTQQTG